VPRDFLVTFGQLRHASPTQHLKKMYRRVTHIASSSQEFHAPRAMGTQQAFTLPALRSLGDLAGR
jgi:hypothetical protein